MGVNAVEKNIPPSMASEDFSYMLKEKPGAIFGLELAIQERENVT